VEEDAQFEVEHTFRGLQEAKCDPFENGVETQGQHQSEGSEVDVAAMMVLVLFAFFLLRVHCSNGRRSWSSILLLRILLRHCDDVLSRYDDLLCSQGLLFLLFLLFVYFFVVLFFVH